MIGCSRCGIANNDLARFCKRCGTPLGVGVPPRRIVSPYMWLKMDEVIHDQSRSIGLLGAVLSFIGGFLPWAGGSVGFMGVQVASFTTGAPAAAGLALFSAVAGLLLFHRRAGLGVLIVGIIVGMSALLFLLSNANSTPALGLIVSIVGAGMIVYSGYQIRPNI